MNKLSYLNRSNRLALLFTVLTVTTGSLYAQETVSVKEITELKAQVIDLQNSQAEIMKQLAEISSQLKSRQQANARTRDLKDVVVSTVGDPIKGNKDAKVVVVEFSDYQCPYCGRHSRQTYPKIVESYVDTDKIKYVFKDLPLERIHSEAVLAATAANCAGHQSQYWEMHDEMFANPKAINPVQPYAEKLGLDMEAFNACLADSETEKEVRDDLAEARRLGVTSTPTFILGLQNEDGSVKAVRLVRGAQSFANFQIEIDKILKTLPN